MKAKSQPAAKRYGNISREEAMNSKIKVVNSERKVRGGGLVHPI
jgi:hypothetical protein